MYKQIFILLIVPFLFVCEIAAQGDPRYPLPKWVYETARERQDFNRRTNRAAPRRIYDERDLYFLKTSRLSKEDKRRLSPLVSDLAANAEFLKQPKTGLAKFVDSSKCLNESGAGSQAVIKVCGGDTVLFYGNNFSFRMNDHTFSANSDLSTKDGAFVAHGTIVQTLLSDLGDISLDKLSPSSESFTAIAEFTSATKIDEVATQFESIRTGLKIGNFYFRNTLPVVLNSTYLLRSIAFRVPKDNGKSTTLSFLKTDRDDIVLAFRVIRKDDDGTTTVLWKELSRKAAPELVFNQDN